MGVVKHVSIGGLAACAALLFIAPLAQGASRVEDRSMLDLPWTLRDHYTFRFEGVTVTYAVDNGQWLLEHADFGTVIESVSSAVTLADGTVIQTTARDEVGVPYRDFTETELGPGVEYGTKLPLHDGVQAQHSMVTLGDYPFTVIRLHVTNRSGAPMAIAKLSPVVIGPGGLKGFGEGGQHGLRQSSIRGRFVTYDPDAAPTGFVLENAKAKHPLYLGVYSLGLAQPLVDLKSHAGAWQGEIACVFSPPRILQPGDTLVSEPVLLSYSAADQEQLDSYLAWAYMRQRKAEPGKPDSWPASWVTIPEEGSHEDLLRDAASWQEAGVRHVLIPARWEVLPGSLRGIAPRFPKDMGQFPTLARNKGFSPGISVNPLAVQQGNDAWSLCSEDGQRWINPANAEARAHAVAQMRKVADMGFDFFVVYPADIPDGVLQQFGLTRPQADALSLEIVQEAAGARPVFPSTCVSQRDVKEVWTGAASAVRALHTCQVMPGPLRLDVNGLRELDADLSAAIREYGGPVELVGAPGGSVAKQFATVLKKDGATYQPETVTIKQSSRRKKK